MLALAAKNDKKQIVLGLEPTGHYWFAIAAWMVSNGISVVQVNPYAVIPTDFEEAKNLWLTVVKYEDIAQASNEIDY